MYKYTAEKVLNVKFELIEKTQVSHIDPLTLDEIRINSLCYYNS